VQQKLQMWAGRPVGSASQWADTVWQPRADGAAAPARGCAVEDSQYLTGFDSQYLDDPAQAEGAAGAAAAAGGVTAPAATTGPTIVSVTPLPAMRAAPQWSGESAARSAAPAQRAAQAPSERRALDDVEGSGAGSGAAPAATAPAARQAFAPSTAAGFASSSQLVAGAETLPPGPSLPVTLGRFAVKSRLPSGRLGRLYEAWDLDRACPAVVRILNPPTEAESRVQLDLELVTTARAAVALKHPHIASVLGAGTSVYGVYVATERLKGRDMRKALALGWRPRPSLTALIAQRLADAVAHAHARGVVHGDIQPANIFLDDLARPKLLDFGIAQVAYSRGVDATEIPLSRLAYLAPEQLLRGVADTRTDIRAIGLVLYELLAMAPAFAAETVGDITRAVLQNQPAPVESLRKNVPKTLVGIAHKAMATDPEQRFATAQEMASALSVWVERHAARKRHLAETNRAHRYGEHRARRKLLRYRLVRPVLLPWALTLSAALMAWQWLPQLKALFEPFAQSGAMPAWAGGATAAGGAAGAAAAPGSSPVSVPTPGSAERTEDHESSYNPYNLTYPTAPGAREKVDAKAVAAAASGAAAASAPAPVQAVPAASVLLTPTQLAQRQAAAAAAYQGVVRLTVGPAAEVLVNGTLVGRTPDLSELKLPVGRQIITLRSEGFDPFTITVMVRSDQTVELSHKFTR
jgi:eukaryotic-like serine/threonine-protein kinase